MILAYYTDQIYLHGGLERVLTNKLTYFYKNTDFELHVITFQQEGMPPCYSLPTKVQLHDLDISYNRNLSFLHPSNLKHILKHYTRLKRKIKEINPDVIVVCNYEFGFYFIPLITRKAIKIREFHSSRHFSYQERLKNKNILKTLIYKLADYVESKYNRLVLLTRDEQQYCKSNNTVVIPNAFTNYPNTTSSLNNKIAISAGRIAPVKQFDKLIKAWYLVASEQPDWKLEIYGDGEQDEVSKLQMLIDENNLENQITLCGSTDELEKKMLNASLFILSSRTECFPMVLLEAMSCGLPIISFDCPNGPRNIVTDEIDGLLVEPNNEKKLAGAILSLINNEMDCKEKGRQARDNVRRFHSDLIMNQWILLFKKLIKSNV